MNRSRFIVGILLIVIAVLMFLFVKGSYSTAGAIAVGVLGLTAVAKSLDKLTKMTHLGR